MKKILMFAFTAIVLIACEKDETKPEDNSNSGITNPTDTTTIAVTGMVSTFAGSNKGLSDGVGTAAQFQFSYNLFSDNSSLFATHPGNFDFITRRSPFIIRKVDIASASVTTLATINDNIYDNANAVKAKAASMVFSGDSIYLALGHRFYAIHSGNGIRRATNLAGTTDNYGHLFLHNNKLHALNDDLSMYEVNLNTGAKTSLYTLDPNKVPSNAEFQDITKIGDLLYMSIKSSDYELYALNLITQTIELISTQTEGATYGYGFDQLLNDGTDIYYMSDGRNSATYTFGKITVSSKTNTLIAAKDKGYIDGLISGSEFDAPSGLTYTNGAMYVFEKGNLKIRKILFN